MDTDPNTGPARFIGGGQFFLRVPGGWPVVGVRKLVVRFAGTFCGLEDLFIGQLPTPIAPRTCSREPGPFVQPNVIAFGMRNRAGLLLFLTATLCSAQAPAPASAPAGPTTRYHDDSMNFDFVYPSSFAASKGRTDDVPRKEQGKGSGAEKADPGCVSVPVAVMDMRTGFDMIFLKRYDQACLSKEITAAGLGTAAAKVLTDTLEQFGKPAISSSTDYDITGHSASAVFGSVKVPHASGKSVIYGAASCVISGKNIGCFQFLSNDCPTLAVLSASTVKFTGAAATPVIPAKLAPACKL